MENMVSIVYKSAKKLLICHSTHGRKIVKNWAFGWDVCKWSGAYLFTVLIFIDFVY